MPSLRSKAVHLVSDLTTVILNPISDEPSKPPVDGQGVKNTEKEASEEDSGDPDGPDTSSFTAFLISLLSSSDTGSHPVEDLNERHAEMGDAASASEIRENSGKKSLLSRGKQSLGRAINKAAKLSGFRQSSEPKTKAVNESKLVEHERRPVKVPQEIASHFVYQTCLNHHCFFQKICEMLFMQHCHLWSRGGIGFCFIVLGGMGYPYQLCTEEACFALATLCWLLGIKKVQFLVA
ncbi:uncharacterized protein LOC120107847 isoform X1 [Phoenix dactylifera]|uniref:Uncharacterized protein LOC120107847 isoform X1 n=1 Tax=Phoenix dactylifera TaxID=42345 RepID=A0A8B9A1F6_PHODC|nr:uncharacterized protein LOC120107847 isoform X1 [Phoenix dactylifera]